MSEFYDNGLRFTCTRCGYCCREEPGYVFLSSNDLRSLPKLFNISRDQFLEKYCRTVDMGSFKLVSLREKQNNDCIFFHDYGCLAYQARPLQCRSYPFWAHVLESRESWEQEGLHCPGIGKGDLHSAEEIEEWLFVRRRERPIEL